MMKRRFRYPTVGGDYFHGKLIKMETPYSVDNSLIIKKLYKDY